MKILHCEVENFASYKRLEFKFDGQGLALISGPTGSGKSTLCDVVPWILFGRTAKGGAVDEILSWPGDEKAMGCLTMELNGKTFQVLRSRNPNDLLFWQDGGVQRGKDINDTQHIINDILGFDLELYLSGAYFHEFSHTAQFFVTTAKNRRQLTEQLVDLSLPKMLTERMTEYRKEIKDELSTMQDKLNVTTGVMKSLQKTINSDVQLEKQWNTDQEKKIVELASKRDDFKNSSAKQLSKALKEHQKKQEELELELRDLEKSLLNPMDITFYRATLAEEKRVSKLTEGKACPACGSPAGKNNAVAVMQREHELDRMELKNENIQKLMNLKVRELSRHNESKKDIKEKELAENPYEKQVSTAFKETNPYTSIVDSRVKEVQKLSSEAADLSNTMTEFKREHADITILLDVVSTFRSVLIKNTVIDLENNTNKILTDYFDSEIRVKFDLADSDKLDVTIWKDGNECVYTQLSKGQRQLLKLSFSISVMKCVSNHHGVDFNAIFLDEALDGLDENLKVKAYGLLQSLALEHESVFVVEHSNELKSMFTNRYNVELTEDGSQLAEA